MYNIFCRSWKYWYHRLCLASSRIGLTSFMFLFRRFFKVLSGLGGRICERVSEKQAPPALFLLQETRVPRLVSFELPRFQRDTLMYPPDVYWKSPYNQYYCHYPKENLKRCSELAVTEIGLPPFKNQTFSENDLVLLQLFLQHHARRRQITKTLQKNFKERKTGNPPWIRSFRAGVVVPCHSISEIISQKRPT